MHISLGFMVYNNCPQSRVVNPRLIYIHENHHIIAIYIRRKRVQVPLLPLLGSLTKELKILRRPLIDVMLLGYEHCSCCSFSSLLNQVLYM